MECDIPENIKIPLQQMIDFVVHAAMDVNPADGKFKSYVKTDIKKIISGLVVKATKDCNGSKSLVEKGLFPQSVILLRCAYEAILTAMYLKHCPSAVGEYLCHYDINSYQDYEDWQNFEHFEGNKELVSEVAKMKNKLDAAVAEVKTLFEKFTHRLSGKDRRTMGSFMSVQKICELVLKEEPDNFLVHDLARTQFYKAASAMVHPNWNYIDEYYIRVNEEPKAYIPAHVIWGIYRMIEQGIILINGFDLIQDQKRLEEIILVSNTLCSSIAKEYPPKNKM